MAGCFNYTGKKAADYGATFSTGITYKPDGTTPADLTGWSAEFIVRESPDGDDKIVGDTDNGKAVIATPTNGHIQVTFNPTDMTTLPRGSYFFLFRLTSGETILELYEGAFEIR